MKNEEWRIDIEQLIIHNSQWTYAIYSLNTKHSTKNTQQKTLNKKHSTKIIITFRKIIFKKILLSKNKHVNLQNQLILSKIETF